MIQNPAYIGGNTKTDMVKKFLDSPNISKVQ